MNIGRLKRIFCTAENADRTAIRIIPNIAILQTRSSTREACFSGEGAIAAQNSSRTDKREDNAILGLIDSFSKERKQR